MIKRKKNLLEQKSVAEKVVFGIMFVVFFDLGNILLVSACLVTYKLIKTQFILLKGFSQRLGVSYGRALGI